MESYRKCFVPTCNNDSKNSSKTIVRIREDLRKQWCSEVNVDYFRVYTQYCCEDHFDPEQDLLNYYYKSENQEPRLKPTAKLRNIAVNLPEEVSSGSQAHESELAKLLLGTQQGNQIKKRKYDDISLPNTSGVISSQPFKVQVAVQATVKMVDKSTNTSFKTKKLSSMGTIRTHSPQQSSTPPSFVFVPVSESPLLFSSISEPEETAMIIKEEF